MGDDSDNGQWIQTWGSNTISSGEVVNSTCMITTTNLNPYDPVSYRNPYEDKIDLICATLDKLAKGEDEEAMKEWREGRAKDVIRQLKE